ncbi:hypothetical protein [Streptomyces sp. NRRL S-118]|uniref:hypothetical protein n=1 Tax=Streptomyces sp. NRRL S-118 TaxID=1463881 RepID=UPI0004C4B85C|nr:hypothetical protein [Streptomyces sp. NRRL S-118]
MNDVLGDFPAALTAESRTRVEREPEGRQRERLAGGGECSAGRRDDGFLVPDLSGAEREAEHLPGTLEPLEPLDAGHAGGRPGKAQGRAPGAAPGAAPRTAPGKG